MKKRISDAHFLLLVTGVCWGLFFFFSFHANWAWNDLTVTTGILSVIVTLASGVTFGQEVTIRQLSLPN